MARENLMKICFYSPYIPDSSVGGGEKHLFDIATVLTQNHKVYIAMRENMVADVPVIRARYENFFKTDLSQLNFITTPLGTDANFLTKLWWTRQFDYLMYWTDGSLFFSLAKQNNLHIQIPFTIDKSGLLERLKLLNWRVKNTNSEFTKNIIEQHWQTKVPFVINPMVELAAFNPKQKKEQVILHVGRFFRQLHSKRQDVLVESFKQLVDSNPELKNWQLVLVGMVEDQQYLEEIKQSAEGYKIKIINDASRDTVIDWFNRAKLYWHATGFGVDQEKNPEKVEHFGITTLEAMAAGAVPVVINKGGQPEILGSELKDNLWQTTSQLQKITNKIIKNDSIFRDRQRLAVNRADKFSKTNFSKSVREMIAKTSGQ